MQDFQLIEYHHQRDFSRKMNATFEFIKQNWRSLGKSILLIAGPPVFIASLMMGSFYGDMINIFNTMGDTQTPLEFFSSPTFWIQFVLAMVMILLSSVMSIATIINYILLYEELKTRDIPTALVWERVRNTFWLYLGTTIYFFFTFLVVGFVAAIPAGVMAAASPGLVILWVWGLMFGLFYLVFSVSLTYMVRAYEGKGFFEAMARSFNLVKGKWWSTFGLILILYFIMVTISYIPMIPVYVVMGISTLHDVSEGTTTNPMEGMSTFIAVLMSLYYMLQLLLSALPNVGIAFQYFNLVERKEARGLMSSIETLGQDTPSPQNDEVY